MIFHGGRWKEDKGCNESLQRTSRKVSNLMTKRYASPAIILSYQDDVVPSEQSRLSICWECDRISCQDICSKYCNRSHYIACSKPCKSHEFKFLCPGLTCANLIKLRFSKHGPNLKCTVALLSMNKEHECVYVHVNLRNLFFRKTSTGMFHSIS